MSKNTHATTLESAFGVHELFFSRTDKKGRILAGNEVFRRVSKFDWDEILNKPHNIIRHPDMPRGVFQLLWDFLGADKPIGAYVKNCAKDGSYYWVFALALPIPDGYISVRLKPTTALLENVTGLYSKLLALESAQNLSPAKAQEVLLKELAIIGFPTYEHFMSHALMAEFDSRHKQMGDNLVGAGGSVSQLKTLLDRGQKLNVQMHEIFAEYFKNKYVPLNLQILSAQGGDEQASLSIISAQFQTLAEEIDVGLKATEEIVNTMIKSILRNQLLLPAATLLGEMIKLFSAEPANERVNFKAEHGNLAELNESYRNQMLKSLSETKAVLNKQTPALEELQTMANGLEIIRLNGKIEMSRVNSHQSDFGTILEELKSFINFLRTNLKTIQEFNADMKYSAEALFKEIET